LVDCLIVDALHSFKLEHLVVGGEAAVFNIEVIEPVSVVFGVKLF